MRWAVLGLWVAVEVSGATMLATFVRRGGFHDENISTGYVAPLIGNFSLGTAAIVPWVIFLITGINALAWASFAQFLATVIIGTVLALPWHRAHRAGQPTPRSGGAPAWTYHTVVEAGHGLLAWATMILAGVVAASH